MDEDKRKAEEGIPKPATMNEDEGKVEEMMPKPAKPPRKKNKIPVRKRLKPVKRHKQSTVPAVPSENAEQHFGDQLAETNQVDVIGSPLLDDENSNLSVALSVSLTDLSEISSLADSACSSRLFSPPSTEYSPTSSPCPPSASRSGTPQTPRSPTPTLHPSAPANEEDSEAAMKALLADVWKKLVFMLPQYYLPMVDNQGVHVLMVGRRESKAVQREIFVSYTGGVRIAVHGKTCLQPRLFSNIREPKPLNEDNVGHFVDRVLQIVNKVRQFEICAGMDSKEFQEVWCHTTNATVDSDNFKECRYKETLRSNDCPLLVNPSQWRCNNCAKLKPFLKRKLQTVLNETVHPKTNIRFLSDEQKNIRLAKMQRTIKNQSQTIERLQCRMQELIKKEGVKIDATLSNDFSDILHGANLNETQSLFLQQQLKAASSKKSCGMRWHPTLIRFALSIYLRAPGAYRQLHDSGFIRLPSTRTLYDYSHATKIEAGIDHSVIESASKYVNNSEVIQFKQYVVLMADEVHISKNLCMQKSTGEVIGFTSLDDIDQEVDSLQQYLDEPDKSIKKPVIASKILSYMIKGVSTSLKDVVASYPVCNPSVRQLYMWTWEVIGALERNDVPVIAFVCDGCSTNRAFIKLHKPATVLPSGVIYDTVNKYAPERKLYFLSDVPHLLKTIRNAFFNSRRNKKGTRSLKKNGQSIVWDSIIRLYLAKKGNTLRKSFKLNAQNVYPDSYSRMKVKPAAEVMSRTVSNDLNSQQWPGTSETSDYIMRVNNWFDLLNGAFSYQGTKTRNHRLNGYTVKDLLDFENGVQGNRFEELLDFLNYLEEWKQDVQLRINNSAVTVLDDLGVMPLEEAASFHVLNDSQQEETEDDAKNLLPHQTLVGIEMSTRAFIDVVSFLLREGVPFVNARDFTQDPLEQNFGKQRMGGGGSSNPNVKQYLEKQKKIHIIGQLAMSNKRGNTEGNEENVLTCEALPKKKYVKKKGLD